MHRAASAYFQTQVTTTSQGELVIMLYDAALKALTQAKEGLENNDMAAKGIAITKTMDILNELDSSLNMDKGGSLSANLHGLYLFCINHLVKANIQKSIPMVEDVIRVVSGLRSAYAEIVELPEAQAAAQEAGEKLQVGNRKARPQAGATSGQPVASAPGAGARARALYAGNTPQQPLAHIEAGPDTEGLVTAAPAQDLSEEDTAQASQETAAAQDRAPALDAPVPQGFPRPPSFGRAMAGAYSKVSGQ